MYVRSLAGRIASNFEGNQKVSSMTKLIPLLFALTSICAHADTYLCVAEAGAVVEDGGDQISATRVDVSSEKYILSNNTGKWTLRRMRDDFEIFDKCYSQYFCEREGGYAGAFLRIATSSNVFSITFMTRHHDINQLVAAKGRCTKL